MFRNQINIRIFFITCFILLASSAVTYLIIAYATPVSYTTMITSRFENTDENILPSFVTEEDNHITSLLYQIYLSLIMFAFLTYPPREIWLSQL